MALVDLINQYSVDGMNQAPAQKETLGKDDFLKLLVMQLKNQDPLEPLKNEEFVAQLAQFNSLEQMINLNKSFESLLALQSMTQASTLIGKQVAWYDMENEPHEGLVQSVTLYGGVPMLNVGGQLIGVDSVVEIAEPQP